MLICDTYPIHLKLFINYFNSKGHSTSPYHNITYEFLIIKYKVE